MIETKSGLFIPLEDVILIKDNKAYLFNGLVVELSARNLPKNHCI